MSAILEVKWNGKRFPLEFASAKDLQQTTVKELKSLCQRITGTDPQFMRINAFGATMNNDDLPLTVYGVRPGCFVTLKLHNKNNHRNQRTSDNNHEVKPSKPMENKEDEKLLEQVNKTQLKIVDDIAPQVKSYEKEAKEFLNKKGPRTDKEKKKLTYTGAYLGEQLMHVLFDLDALIFGSDNTKARQARKEAVQSAQVLLDKVDEIKSFIKNVTIVDENN